MKKQEIKTGAKIRAYVAKSAKRFSDYRGAEAVERLYKFALKKAENRAGFSEPDRSRKIGGKLYNIWDSVTVEFLSGSESWDGRVCSLDVAYYEHISNDDKLYNFIRI